METRNIVYISAEVVVGVVSVVGNTIVLVAIWRTPQLHTITNVFVGNLAVADIAVGLLVAPCAALSFQGLPRDFYGCMLINSLILLFTNVSILMLLAVALERFLAIKEPYAYHRLMTTRRAILANLAVWFLGIFIGLVPMYGWNTGAREIETCQFVDVIPYEYMVYFQFFGFVLLPLFLMLCIYVYIYAIVRRHTKQTNALHRQFQHNHRPGAQDGSVVRESRSFNKDVRAAKMFALVILLFGLFWLPVNIFNCVSLFCGPSCTFPYEALLAAIVMSHANSSVNPFLYAASNSQIKAAIWKIFGAKINSEEVSTDNAVPNRHSNNDDVHSNRQANTSPNQAASHAQVIPARQATEPGPSSTDHRLTLSAGNLVQSTTLHSNNTNGYIKPQVSLDVSSIPTSEHLYHQKHNSAESWYDDVFELETSSPNGASCKAECSNGHNDVLFKRTFTSPLLPLSRHRISPTSSFVSDYMFLEKSNDRKSMKYAGSLSKRTNNKNKSDKGKNDKEIILGPHDYLIRRNSFPNIKNKDLMRTHISSNNSHMDLGIQCSTHVLNLGSPSSTSKRCHSNAAFESDGENISQTDKMKRRCNGFSEDFEKVTLSSNGSSSHILFENVSLDSTSVLSSEYRNGTTMTETVVSRSQTRNPNIKVNVLPLKTVSSAFDPRLTLGSPSLCVEVEQSGMLRNTRTEQTKL